MVEQFIIHHIFWLKSKKKYLKNTNVPTRSEVMEKLIPYIQEETSKGTQLNHIMRHTVGLFHGRMARKLGNNIYQKICVSEMQIFKR